MHTMCMLKTVTDSEEFCPKTVRLLLIKSLIFICQIHLKWGLYSNFSQILANVARCRLLQSRFFWRAYFNAVARIYYFKFYSKHFHFYFWAVQIQAGMIWQLTHLFELRGRNVSTYILWKSDELKMSNLYERCKKLIFTSLTSQ